VPESTFLSRLAERQQPSPPIVPAEDVRYCRVCGGFVFHWFPIEKHRQPTLTPWQKLGRSSHPDFLILFSCSNCATFPMAASFGRETAIAKEASAGSDSMQAYATAQLLFHARRLAMSHLERRGRIKADGKSVPICDTCGTECAEPEGSQHAPDCAVGHTLHWIEQLSRPSTAAPPAPRASSAAGDLSALVGSISSRASEIYNGDGSSSDLADAKDLIRALARLVNGESLRAAFGAPGDWGYSTAIGQALAKAYNPATAVNVGVDLSSLDEVIEAEIAPAQVSSSGQVDGDSDEVEQGVLEPEGVSSYWRGLDGGVE
jgi:hypothetical protein